jgi:hypothetical protein
MADAVETRHEYRITNPAGTYLGILPNVKSDFTYNREINTSFVEIQVSVELSADVAPLLVTPLETESGETITTEDSEPIYPERQPDVVSSTSSKAMIQNNNRVQVYEFSTWYPSGLLVFDGYINKWQASFGGTDIVTFTARSLADDMNDYILTGGNYTSELSQLVYSTSDGLDISGSDRYLLQYITPTTSFAVKKLRLNLFKSSSMPYYAMPSVTATVGIYQSGVLLGSSSAVITNWSQEDVDFGFTQSISLSIGIQYVIKVSGAGVVISSTNTNPYAGGIVYNYNGTSLIPLPTWDLYFNFFSQLTLTDYVFDDATASEIAQAAMDDYISKGGRAYYDSTDTDNFPTQTEINDYTFKAATILEVEKKALSLSTDDIYYKVDPGSQLYFFGKVTTATNGVGTVHKLILGKHFKQVEVGASVDEVRNVVSFTGGDVGAGVNLFTEYSDLTSIATQGRQRLERVVDNRVTIANTADSIAATILAAKSEEKNFGTVEVLNSVYNTRLIEVGHAVQFKGIGNFLEDELYTVVSQSPTPDSMRLVLGFIPNRLQDTVDQLIGDVQQIQTVDNPDAPS